ncbi:MAG: hypothetical protein GY863_19455 [bacterium]|nr:hypothetical protein [bacterium]
MNSIKKLPAGIKVIIGFHVLSTIIWTIGQTGAIFFYDTIASWGLQELRELSDPVIIEVNRGIALVDSIVMLPLHMAAAAGLWRLNFFGAVTSWMVFGISLYWPIEAISQRFFYAGAGIKHIPFDIGVYIILACIIIFSGWASWYLLKNRNLFELITNST